MTYAAVNFDFAASKTLDPRIAFARNSVGTYFDAAGVLKTASADAARFDHNPITLGSLGLLVEEDRRTLALRSAELDNN